MKVNNQLAVTTKLSTLGASKRKNLFQCFMAQLAQGQVKSRQHLGPCHAVPAASSAAFLAIHSQRTQPQARIPWPGPSVPAPHSWGHSSLLKRAPTDWQKVEIDGAAKVRTALKVCQRNQVAFPALWAWCNLPQDNCIQVILITWKDLQEKGNTPEDLQRGKDCTYNLKGEGITTSLTRICKEKLHQISLLFSLWHSYKHF